MASVKCAFDFGDVASQDIKDYLTNNCEKLMEARECMIEQKQLYDNAIIPIIENPTLIAKLDKLSAAGELALPIKKFEDFGITSDKGIDEIKTFYSPVDSAATELNIIYDYYKNYFKEADPDEEEVAKIKNPPETFYELFFGDDPVPDIEGRSKAKKLKIYLTKISDDSEYAKNNLTDLNGEISESEVPILENIIKSTKDAKKVVDASKECAKTIRDVEKEHKRIAGDEVGLAITARGDYSGLDPGASAAAATSNLKQSGAAGTGITIIGLPENFREQCLFLAQIFQFAEFHRDIQMGGESETFDAGDFAARARKSAAAATKGKEISVDKKLPYYPEGSETNSSLIIEGGAWGFINKLTQYPGMSDYFDATNAQLAHLQPMIRLFKVTPSNGQSEKEQEFAFDTFASKEDVEQILTRREKRGFGVGIEKFSFTFHGSNPFAIKKSIKASLVIKANNFDELLKNRDGLRYIDLALRTGSAIEEKYDKSDLNFRIKACVGLSIPRGKTTANFSSIINGVRNNFATVNLTPVTHTFDFDDTGAVTFSIEYLAYIEEYFDQARMNIFADTEVSNRIIQRKLGILSQKKRCSTDEETKSLNEFLKKDAENVKADKLKSLKFLTNQLLKNNLIYYLNLTKDEFIKLVRNGPFYDLNDIRSSISLNKTGDKVQEISKNLEETFNRKYAETNGAKKDLQNSFLISGIESKNYAFFYLGDLVDLLLQKIPENLQSLNISEKYLDLEIDKELLEKEKKIISNSILQFKKFRFALGPLEIIDHKDGQKSKEISFADVPIALDYFNEWLTSKVLAKEEPSYSLTTFLNDLMNDFITNFLNDDSCYSFNIKQRVRMFQNVITSYSETPDNDSITNYLGNNGLSRLNLNNNNLRQPYLSTGGYRDLDIPLKSAEKEFHFFVFYAGRVQPKELMQGNRATDHGNGIFHYLLGRDKGIVKEIKLDKTDSPASLKMVRFEQEGYDGLRQLREIYDVSINTFANLQTYPGTYIYVEPRGFSPSLGSGDIDFDKFDLTDLGIGGYYMIIESTHEFSSGVMDTSFKAKWVQSLDTGEGELDRVSNSSVGDGGVTAKKCSVRS